MIRRRDRDRPARIFLRVFALFFQPVFALPLLLHPYAWARRFGWREEPLGAMLQDATGMPVLVSNDATLGATAESVFGAARGFSDAVYLNGGSSGIGGGIIANGAPLRGVDGFAGEFGHTHAGPDDKTDAATRLEDYLR